MKTFFYYFDRLNFPWIFLFFDIGFLARAVYGNEWDWCVVWLVICAIQAGVIDLQRKWNNR